MNGLFEITDLKAGSYSWKFFANDTSKNLNHTENWIYKVLKATSNINLTIDGNNANKTISIGETTNYTAKILTPDNGNLELYDNGTLINNGSTLLENLTAYQLPGLHNITIKYIGSENYSSISKTLWLEVIDSATPAVLNLTTEPDTQKIGLKINITVNVTDDVNVSVVKSQVTYPNGTTKNYTMTDTNKDDVYNHTFNNTLQTGLYNVTIWTNDTNNNINDTEKTNFTITYDTLAIITDSESYLKNDTIEITGTGYSAN